jgi:hypothetical protein
MKRLLSLLKKNPHVAISVPTILCFITFITNLVSALSDGVIDSTELHQLLSTADGFETVLLFVIMIVLRNKKK